MQLAICFDAEYKSGARANPALMVALQQEVAAWRAAWQGLQSLPELVVQRVNGARLGVEDEAYSLRDTRGLAGVPEAQLLNGRRAALILVGTREQDHPDLAWAVKHRLVAEMDSRWVPLAVAAPAVLRHFEQLARDRGINA
jgi:hypothetical protein